MPYPPPPEGTTARLSYDLLGAADRRRCDLWWETDLFGDGFDDLPKKRRMRIFAALGSVGPKPGMMSETASFDASAGEMEMIDRAADAAGRTRSEFLRSAALIEAAAVVDELDDGEDDLHYGDSVDVRGAGDRPYGVAVADGPVIDGPVSIHGPGHSPRG